MSIETAAKFAQTDKLTSNEHGVVEHVPLKNGSKIPVLYSTHYIEQLAKRRTVSKNNLPVSYSTIKNHFNKVFDHISNNPPTGSGVKKYAYVDKKTGHKIVADVGREGVHFKTHLNNEQPIDDFENPRNPRHIAGKSVTLEQVIYEKVMEKFVNNQIITIVLD